MIDGQTKNPGDVLKLRIIISLRFTIQNFTTRLPIKRYKRLTFGALNLIFIEMKYL